MVTYSQSIRSTPAGVGQRKLGRRFRFLVTLERDEELADMVIEREELDRREVDLSDVTTGRRLSPVHPGGILHDEFLRPMESSVYRLAQELKIPRPRLNDVVLGRRGVTVDLALRLGCYFGTTPEFWINLQTRYDLDVAERTVLRRIEREIKPYRG